MDYPGTFPRNIYRGIKDHAEEQRPNECCGFILEDENRVFLHRVTNIAPNPQIEARIALWEIREAERKGTAIGFYHSHTGFGCDFSPYDREMMESILCTWVLYCVRSDKWLEEVVD